MNMKWFILLGPIFTSATSVAGAQEAIRVPAETERRVWAAYSTFGDEVCFGFRTVNSGAPSRVRVRRTLNGQPRDLDVHRGAACVESSSYVGRQLVIYVTALDEDTDVSVTKVPPQAGSAGDQGPSWMRQRGSAPSGTQ